MTEEKPQNKPNISPAAYFLSDMRVGFNHEIFHYVFLSGTEGIQHVSTPRMAKFILQTMQSKIAEFEQQYGEIKMEEQKQPQPEQFPEQQTPDSSVEKQPQSLGEKVKSTAGVVKQTLQDTKKIFEDTLKMG